MKKILLLLVLLLVLTTSALGQTEIFLTYDFVSRYIVYGVDFLPDDLAFNNVGILISSGNLSVFSYIGVGKDLNEWAALVNYSVPTEKVDFKTTLFTFGWKYKGEDAEPGVIVGEEVTFHTFLSPTLGTFYVWLPNSPEISGYYIFLSLSKKILTLDCNFDLGYNNQFLTESRGFNTMFGLSKSISLGERVNITMFLRYYLNDPDINKDETVLGVSTSFKLF